MEKKHRKHAKMTKPTSGKWAKTDLGVFGNDCAAIEAFCGELACSLPLSTVYVDTDHGSFDNPTFSNQKNSGFTSTRIETPSTLSLHLTGENAVYSANKLKMQLALVNSNHFEAARTILLYSEKKIKSILKRTQQLEACFAVVLSEGDQLPQEIKERLNTQCLFFSMSELAPLLEKIQSFCPAPIIKGLVLAGGQSTRMGKDKTVLNLHGKPQFEHLASLLDPLCDQVYISVSAVHTVDTTREVIPDKFTGLGPYAAILSAFQQDPDAAWLVLASDLPNITSSVLEQLIDQRASSKLATAFLNSETGFPDPLCTLWEPSSHPRLLEFLALGYSCPRKVLINSSISVIKPIDANALFNLNTPEDLARFEGME
ncbi:MAG: molybdopterin-guanine dinucleotide biosynthesis protein A [Flavobacteriales bacterium]